MKARSTARRDLNELARLYGVQRSYADVSGERRHASAEALFLTLRALGAPLDSPAEAGEALRARIALLRGIGTDPVHVAWGGRLAYVNVRVPARTARSAAQLTLRLESGERRSWRAAFEPGTGRADDPVPAFRLRLGGALPIGYHELEIETRGGTLTSRILAAPRYAHTDGQACTWGVFAPLYALRTADDDGAGDFADLAALAQWAGSLGGRFVGTLPLLAAFVHQPFEPSPYSPVSRLFWNEFYVTPRDGRYATPPTTATPPMPLVDYRAVAALRRSRLQQESTDFFADTGDVERAEFEQFAAAHPRLHDYARFRAVCDRLGTGWQSWPQPLRDGTLQQTDAAPADEQYYLYSQWRADQQLLAIGRAREDGSAALYLDMPLGVNPDGYDAWRFRHIFVEGASAGAPPDVLFTGGQDWGFRPFSPERLRATGYGYLVEVLRHHLRHARMLRLDHVMALFRLYWIPAGLSAREGVYVQYPADEMLAVLLIESARHHSRIVGEDLGTVPRAVRAAMDRRRIQRIFVVQYELSGEAQLNPAPRNAVASINTHDMPPFAGFVRAAEVDDQVDLELVTPAEAEQARAARTELVARLHRHFATHGDERALLEALLRLLAAGDARTVLVNLEDLWLERNPQNVPGTCDERPNWRRRFPRTLDDIMKDPAIAATLQGIDALRCGAGMAGSTNPD